MPVPTIIDWLDWDAAYELVRSGKAQNREEPIFGGSWRPIKSWQAYLQSYPEESRPHLDTLRDTILQLGFRRGHYWFERGDRWAPLFADGSLLLFGSDSWCELQAAIWSDREGVPYQPYDWVFAMGSEEPVRDRSGGLTYAYKTYSFWDPKDVQLNDV